AALRTLTVDDITGLCTIYPNATTRNVSPTAQQPASIPAGPCDPNPRHGLATECVSPAVEPQAHSGSHCNAAPPTRTRAPAAFGAAVALGAAPRRRRTPRA